MAEIRAEITASVWKVVVDEGQAVAEGDEIAILESMKMEIPVIAEDGGKVEKFTVAETEAVGTQVGATLRFDGPSDRRPGRERAVAHGHQVFGRNQQGNRLRLLGRVVCSFAAGAETQQGIGEDNSCTGTAGICELCRQSVFLSQIRFLTHLMTTRLHGASTHARRV